MPLTRRALILSAAATSVVAPLASAAPSRPPAPPPNGLWRSRSTADLVVFDKRVRQTYTCYSRAVALVDESSLEEVERETLDAQLENDNRLELEYWGTVTRFQYDRINDWPVVPRLGGGGGGGGDWESDPGMTVDAFFEVLAGHFAFAKERGIDWRALRAECDAVLRRRPVLTPDHLFDTLAATLRHLEDGHGSLSDKERYSESRSSTSRLYQAWKTAGGRPLDGDFYNGFSHDWLDYVQRRILPGAGHLAAQDVVAWGKLPSGMGYISLMLCEGLSEVEGGHADVIVVSALPHRKMLHKAFGPNEEEIPCIITL